MFDSVDGGWAGLLQGFADSSTGRSLCQFVDARVAGGALVYPGSVLRAFALTPRAAVRAVILGQDPYHGPGQAEGLAFSVAPGQRLPPSLRNILAEWQRDLGHQQPASGSLQPWAQQGVLLLNSALTVEDGRPGSHAQAGWRVLTDSVVQVLANDPAPKAFLLWGAHAQAQAARVAQAGGRHLLLQCNHPSPLAARRPPVPFVGCGHFGRARSFLVEQGRGVLDWTLA
jgi:uracil-DNA glycosylase